VRYPASFVNEDTFVGIVGIVGLSVRSLYDPDFATAASLGLHTGLIVKAKSRFLYSMCGLVDGYTEAGYVVNAYALLAS
jgi:hypothetical protein